MRSYWLRIALGAFGIFAIGMLVWNLARAGKTRVKHIVESAEPVTIPLALIPFKVDGQSLGTMRQVQIIRSDPKKVSAVNFRVRLSDSVADARLGDCVLVMGGSLKNIDAQHAFNCVKAADTVGSDLAPVGDVKSQRGRTYVLFAKAGALDSIDIDFDHEATSDSIAAAQEAFGDSIRDAQEGKADSIRASAELMADSIRAGVDSIIAANRHGLEQARKPKVRSPAPPPAPAAPKR